MTPRFIRTPTGIIRYDNNFTDIEKIKLENIENGAQVNTILGIKGSNEDNFRIGYIIITKDNIGLCRGVMCYSVTGGINYRHTPG